MNGKCIYIDEKVIVEDKNGNKRVVEYSDKLDEILVQENIVESLEKELDEVDKDIGRRKKLNKTNKSVIYFSAISFSTIPLIIQILLRFLLGENASEIILSTEPMMQPFIKGFITSITVIFGSFFTISSYNAYKNNKKVINGQRIKKKVLEEIIQEEKIELEQLHQTTQKLQSTQQFYEKEVDYLDTLKRIRYYLNLYYDCEYNREKFIKYLQAGKLEKKLEKYYTIKDIDLIKEYLKDTTDIDVECINDGIDGLPFQDENTSKLIRKLTPPKHTENK